MKRGVLLIVRWQDAWANHGYYTHGSDYTPEIMEDVGWFMEENDKTIVLARSRDPEDDSYRNLSVIILDDVISIEEWT